MLSFSFSIYNWITYLNLRMMASLRSEDVTPSSLESQDSSLVVFKLPGSTVRASPDHLLDQAPFFAELLAHESAEVIPASPQTTVVLPDWVAAGSLRSFL